MSLRDKNPLIDSDLEIVITTFEKAMVKSRDSDSVFVPFRRGLEAAANFPKSVQAAIDKVPLSPSTSEETSDVGLGPAVPSASTDDPMNPSEEGSDDANWKEKLKDWAQNCIPCDFRTLSSIDAEFFSEIGDKWSEAFDQIESNLESLEDQLDGTLDRFTGKFKDAFSAEGPSDESIKEIKGEFESDLQQLCELGNAFKSQCVPDLKKMLFVLTMFLDNMENEFSLDLGVFDSFLVSILSPVFNEMAANLDLIDEIALGPVKCIMDQLQRQIERGPQVAQDMFDTGTQVLANGGETSRRLTRQSQEQASEVVERLRQHDGQPAPVGTSPPSRAQQAAERAQAELQATRERASRRTRGGMDRINQTFSRIRETTNFLQRFKEYLKTAFDYVEDKKDWLISLVEEFLSVDADWWGDQLSFAHGKRNILDYIAILRALIDAAKTGGFSCGPDSDSMTAEELNVFFSVYKHPSESLEVHTEGGTIIVVRNPNPSRPVREGGEEGGEVGMSAGGGDGQAGGVTELGNVVVRRPISSCLKKVTPSEAEQVYHWIQQLE